MQGHDVLFKKQGNDYFAVAKDSCDLVSFSYANDEVGRKCAALLGSQGRGLQSMLNVSFNFFGTRVSTRFKKSVDASVLKVVGSFAHEKIRAETRGQATRPLGDQWRKLEERYIKLIDQDLLPLDVKDQFNRKQDAVVNCSAMQNYTRAQQLLDEASDLLRLYEVQVPANPLPRRGSNDSPVSESLDVQQIPSPLNELQRGREYTNTEDLLIDESNESTADQTPADTANRPATMKVVNHPQTAGNMSIQELVNFLKGQ
ncbi:hypothetical protein LOC72_00355 [Roseiconus lacunae]|nr:hypothetical protein [Roseiconus lacunae]